MTTPFHQLHHICVVVHELEKAVEYYESLGIGPWHDYPPLTAFTRRSMPNDEAFLALRYRYADLGNVQLQLCQPPDLDCPQRRFLDTRGEGVFHVGFEHPLRDAEASGLPVLMRAERDNGTGFLGFDTVDQTGFMLLTRQSAE
ncbi:VOC family protein [Lentzea sp. PSKA42]|uniref:VOC family protein n=1 Tax=Lentzea indica TaxID=2604800 RepID=A0ABX1FGS6_9PSEU|nr:VOC family protein [Lentzea indica]NKE58173.1 VOC family protein [Lentzea indica]